MNQVFVNKIKLLPFKKNNFFLKISNNYIFVYIMLRHLSTKATLEESRIKIIIVGDKNVGKTSFLIRFLFVVIVKMIINIQLLFKSAFE